MLDNIWCGFYFFIQRFDYIRSREVYGHIYGALFCCLSAVLVFLYLRKAGFSAVLRKILSHYGFYAGVLAAAALLYIKGNIGLEITDEKYLCSDALAAVRSGNYSFLSKANPFIALAYILLIKAGGVSLLYMSVFMLAGMGAFVWTLILQEFEIRELYAAVVSGLAVVLSGKLFFQHSFYHQLGFFTTAVFLLLLIRLVKEKDPRSVWIYFLSVMAVFAAIVRQENVVLFALLAFTFILVKRSLLKHAVVAAFIGFILYMPVFLYLWKMESWKMQRMFEMKITVIDDSARMLLKDRFHENRPSPDSKYGHLCAIFGWISMHGYPFEKTLAITEKLYNAPHPGAINIWYNLRYRDYPLVLILTVWVSIAAVLNILKGPSPALIILDIYTVLFFLVFYLANFWVHIEPAYYYVFPAYAAQLVIYRRHLREKS